MKLAMISPTGHQFGAFARQSELAKGLVKEGKEVVWLGPRVSHPVEGVHYIELGPGSKTLRFPELRRRAKQSLSAIASSIDGYICFREYDVLLFAPFAQAQSRHVIWFSRGDIIANELLNQADGLGIGAIRHWLKLGAYAVLRRRALRGSGTVVVQTPQLEWQLRFMNPLVNKDIVVLPNNSNASWMERSYRNTWLAKNHDVQKVVGYIGRIGVNRGLEELVRSIGSLRGETLLKLKIFGPDIGNGRLQELIGRLGLNDVVSLAGVTTNPLKEMQQMDVLVANRFVEGCPNVVLEAMSVGVPIVSTNIPAYRFLLGKGGIYYRPGDDEDLSRVLRQLLLSLERRAQYSKYLAERSALFEFDWAAAAAGIVEAAVRKSPIVVRPEVRRILDFEFGN